MPGFATSEGTKANAWKLMDALGVTGEEIDIRPAARQMLADMGHPFAEGEPVYDVTFENVQAGLRTDYLFRLANQRRGFVIGTGDLSELALGWCTYGVGDQMSHYGVNAGVPKTLIQYLIRWCVASDQFDAATDAVLEAILGTEISPELVPAEAGADPEHRGEDRPLRAARLLPLPHAALRPAAVEGRVPRLARLARPRAPGSGRSTSPRRRGAHTTCATIARWLESFLWRFFAFAQFKRSALPNGPKVSAGGALSPRGDWRAPSDATAAPWLDELRRSLPPGTTG